jgi:hypothetical protein
MHYVVDMAVQSLLLGYTELFLFAALPTGSITVGNTGQ